MNDMKLKVFASLSEDINNGWVWVPESLVGERSVVRIKNGKSGKVIFCEALQIGENYLTRYNTNDRTYRIDDKNKTIVMSEWYRKKLGIPETQTEIEFEVMKKDNPWGHLRASLHHPQIVVRLAMKLAILSIVLGAIGVYLGVVGIQK
jgi:hypothetical protein